MSGEERIPLCLEVLHHQREEVMKSSQAVQGCEGGGSKSKQPRPNNSRRLYPGPFTAKNRTICLSVCLSVCLSGTLSHDLLPYGFHWRKEDSLDGVYMDNMMYSSITMK